MSISSCEECGRYGPCDKHHIVFKGMGGSIILDYPLNIKQLGNSFLCNHHEGPDGPHHQERKNLQYRQELQVKLNNIFFKDYYKASEIKKLVQYSDKQIKALTKLLQLYPEGYKKEDIILELMGGKLYEVNNTR